MGSVFTMTATNDAQGGGVLAGFGPLLSTKDAARLLDVSVGHVQRLCREGSLPSVKIGRRVYVLRDELAAMVEAQARA